MNAYSLLHPLLLVAFVYSSSDAQLRDFENASRELGSSVGIVWSAFRLQERLAKILFLFRENAACLYPRKITRKSQEVLLNPNVMERREDWRNRSTIPQSQDNLELHMLPDQLGGLAGDVGAFINCLNEFEEFNDEAISQSMRAFEGDLRVGHIFSCLGVVSRLSHSCLTSVLFCLSLRIQTCVPCRTWWVWVTSCF